jgi:hypothetical protein
MKKISIKDKDQFFNFLVENYQHKKNRVNKCPDRYCKINNLKPNLYDTYEEANFLLQLCHKFKFDHIIRTKSNAIKRKRLNSVYGAYDLQEIRNSGNQIIRGYVLTILFRDYYWKFTFGMVKTATDNGGFGSWLKFVETCKECGINIEDYAIDPEEGKKVKAEIESPLIALYDNKHKLQHVNHLDLHSAYPSALIEKYPEFEPVFAKLKKPIGDIAIGYMQSKYVNYRYAHLAKLAVNAVVQKIITYSYFMKQDNFEIVMYNTDGIWYYDKTGQNRLFHNIDEGQGFGKWEHDYIDCTYIGITDGKYCFYKPDGTFVVKLRGLTKKDAEKPRSEWTYEDFTEACLSEQSIYFDQNIEQFKIVN